MPINPIRNFECEISPYMPNDRVMMINFKLNHLHKLKSNGDNSLTINYYIQELNRMKTIYSHLGAYIPEIDIGF